MRDIDLNPLVIEILERDIFNFHRPKGSDFTLRGFITLGTDSITFGDKNGFPVVWKREGGDIPPELRKYIGRPSAVHFAARRSWLKHWHKPYYEVSIELDRLCSTEEEVITAAPTKQDASPTSDPVIASVKEVRSAESQPKGTNEIHATQPEKASVPAAKQIKKIPIPPDQQVEKQDQAGKKTQAKRSKTPAAKKAESAKKSKSKKQARSFKRAPDDFYADKYTFERTILVPSDDAEAEAINVLKAKDIGLDGPRGPSRDYRILLPDDFKPCSVKRSVFPGFADLLDVGYKAKCRSVEVEEEPELVYRRFDKVANMAWEEYKTERTARALFVLSRPARLLGEGVSFDDLRSTKTKARRSPDLHRAVLSASEAKGLYPAEALVVELLALDYTKPAIIELTGWKPDGVSKIAKDAYEKLGIRKKDELVAMVNTFAEKRQGASAKSPQTKMSSVENKRNVNKSGTSSGVAKTSYVGVADFIVRSHGYSCKHKSHEMDPVEASVTIMTAGGFLREKTFSAFYCKQCGKYFVTNDAFERLTRSGRLCCRVMEIDDVVNPKGGAGRFANYANESVIRQYGYNVSKQEDLSSGERQAILSFVIENDVMSQYEIISFLDTLIDTREGMANMQDAVAKWREDVRFLEHYRPPKRSLRVGTLYARKSRL